MEDEWQEEEAAQAAVAGRRAGVGGSGRGLRSTELNVYLNLPRISPAYSALIPR